MHLRVYESTSTQFEHCPKCHELTYIKGDPYFVPSNSPIGPGLLILTRDCVNCGYSTEDRRRLPPGGRSSGDSGGWGGFDAGGGSDFSGGSDFGGGSSGGGGAGGDW